MIKMMMLVMMTMMMMMIAMVGVMVMESGSIGGLLDVGSHLHARALALLGLLSAMARCCYSHGV